LLRESEDLIEVRNLGTPIRFPLFEDIFGVTGAAVAMKKL
jgi:hypothetical protein